MYSATPLFFQALAIGFAVAVPLGPIGLLCIERTLRLGLMTGLATGLGVALADASYGALVATGAALFAEALSDHERTLRSLGGLALAAIGLRALLRAGQSRTVAVQARGALFLAFASAYLLTLANPATIASFAAIFAGLGLSRTAATPDAAAAVVAGVFLGSLLWWIVLSAAIAALRHRLPPAVVAWINRGAGTLLTAAGLWLFLAAF
ncbi:MAG: LysE family transporter [Rhodovibrionaceae bacterium]